MEKVYCIHGESNQWDSFSLTWSTCLGSHGPKVKYSVWQDQIHCENDDDDGIVIDFLISTCKKYGMMMNL